MILDENEVAVVSIMLELFALVVTALLLLSAILTQEKHDKRDRLFIAMLVTNGTALLCDVITWIWEGPQYIVLIYTANFWVFSLGYVMTALFTMYLSSFIEAGDRLTVITVRAVYVLSVVSVMLVAVSLFNGMYFYVEDGILQSGDFGWLSIVLTLVMIVADMGMILFHRKKIGARNMVAFLSYGIFPIIGFCIQMTGTELTATWLASTLTMLLIYLMVQVGDARELDHKRVELAESKRELTESQTALMISQIQPHFLYNSLAAVDQLIKTDPIAARKALAEFSTYLRCNLSSLKYNGMILFSDELRHVRAYLRLEQMRYGDYLKVVYDIRTESFHVPSLSVQPLVENAVQHGLSDKKEGGTVTIETREQQDCYVITVTDDGVGFVPGEMHGGGEHIGMENIRSRLSMMCGGRLDVQSEKGVGTKAVVTIYKE